MPDASQTVPLHRKYQIFVSSTFEDLKEERRAVTEVILSMRHIPVGMELFAAGNKDQWSYIKNRILEVDYYLVIVAERYGSLGPAKLSYTEMEYRYAVEQGVPVAALLLDEKKRLEWPQGKSDGQKKKLNAFRALCQKRMVAYWSDIGSLASKCQLALNGMFTEEARTGWVPANFAISPQIASELARLSDENSKLRAQLEQFADRKAVDPDLEKAVSVLQRPIAHLLRNEAAFAKAPHDVVWEVLSKAFLGEFFWQFTGPMLDGEDEEVIYRRFANYLGGNPPMHIPNDGPRGMNRIVNLVFLALRAFGIIEAFTLQTPPGPTKALRLTALGRRAFERILVDLYGLSTGVDGERARPHQ